MTAGVLAVAGVPLGVPLAGFGGAAGEQATNERAASERSRRGEIISE